MNNQINANRRILQSFDITLEDYLKLDKDVRISLLREYWNFKSQNNQKKEFIKTKILRFFNKK